MAGPNVILQIVTKAHALSTNESVTKNIINVYNFRRSTVPGNPSKAAAVTAFKTSILTPLADCLSVSYVTDYIDARWLDDPLDAFLSSALAINGAEPGDSLPSLNNATVHMLSGFRGKSNRGSKHYGPIAESHTTLDHLTSAALTLWSTFFTAMLAGITAGDGFFYTPFILSQLNSSLWTIPPNIRGVDCTLMNVNPILGQMRRRKEPSRQ